MHQGHKYRPMVRNNLLTEKKCVHHPTPVNNTSTYVFLSTSNSHHVRSYTLPNVDHSYPGPFEATWMVQGMNDHHWVRTVSWGQTVHSMNSRGDERLGYERSRVQMVYGTNNLRYEYSVEISGTTVGFPACR